MSLRNQPYFPMYVQDFLTDEKLNECSAQSTGVYIKVMCVMHKSDEYGTILLKQKDKQKSSNIENFAYKLLKHLPYDYDIILDAITELVNESVLTIEGDKLYQRRMVKDNYISETRSKAGSKGGKTTQFAKAKPRAKVKANSENENENESEGNGKDEGGLGETEKTWRSDYETYYSECNKAFENLSNDKAFIAQQSELNPGVDVLLSMKKGFVNFWGTEAGWKHKKKSKGNINWKLTVVNAISLNKVFKPKDYNQTRSTDQIQAERDYIKRITAK